jgi:hypothetical protein
LSIYILLGYLGLLTIFAKRSINHIKAFILGVSDFHAGRMGKTARNF